MRVSEGLAPPSDSEAFYTSGDKPGETYLNAPWLLTQIGTSDIPMLSSCAPCPRQNCPQVVMEYCSDTVYRVKGLKCGAATASDPGSFIFSKRVLRS